MNSSKHSYAPFIKTHSSEQWQLKQAIEMCSKSDTQRRCAKVKQLIPITEEQRNNEKATYKTLTKSKQKAIAKSKARTRNKSRK